MTLIGAGLLNAIAVVVRILSMVALNKILAIYVGPSGYALVGQFQSLVQMLSTFASGAVATGVTKGTAEHFDDPEYQIRIWRTAGTVATIGAVGIGATLIVFNTAFARWLLADPNLGIVFIALALSLFPIVLNSLLLAILNGKKHIWLFVVINIAGSLIGLVTTGGLAVLFGLPGALIALSANLAVVFPISALVCARQPWFRLSMLFGTIDARVLRDLLKFTAMALTASAVTPFVQILIRDHLIADFGAESAGYWEALMRISNLYLMVVTVPLSVYYLPRIAEIRDTAELRSEISSGYAIILPVTIIGALAIFLLRDFITLSLFTPDFLPMRELFLWQMVGDVLKIAGWLLGYVLIARGMVVPYIVTEVTFGVSWYIMVLALTEVNGLQGAQMAYAANYSAYAVVLGAYLWNRSKRSRASQRANLS